MTATLEQPTFNDIWRIFQETYRQMKERAAELDRKFQETERLMKERAAESDRKFRETERLMKESSAETERLMKERAAETDKIVKNLSKNLGDLGNRLGEFVEHMVAPAVVRLFQDQGIEVHEVYAGGVKGNRNGEALEIDLLVINDGALVAVECKSKLTEEHIDDHLVRLEKLKRVLPRYTSHRVLGAVAAMVIDDKVKDYAFKHGLFVLRQNGDSIEIGNPEGFSPAVW